VVVSCGQRRLELASCYRVYQRLPVLEHFNRFVKQHLLFNAAHLGVTEHEKKFVRGGLWPIRNSIWLALRYPARCDLGNATNLSRLTNVRPHPPKLDAAMLDFSPGWVKL
jgi:hypothetical protein